MMNLLKTTMLAILIGFCPVPVLQAQIVGDYGLPAGYADAFIPDYLRRDLPALADELNLADEQVLIVQTLFEDYQDRFRKASAEVSGAMSRLRPPGLVYGERYQALQDRMAAEIATMTADFESSDDQSEEAKRDLLVRIMDRKRLIEKEAAAIKQQITEEAITGDNQQAISRTLSEWGTTRQTLGAEFEANILAVLSETQQDNWPSAQKRLRREKQAGRGRLSGESVDLTALIRQRSLEAETMQAITPTLEEYAARLDRAYVDREASFASSAEALDRAVAARDDQAARRILDERMTHRVRVREVNHEMSRRLAELLPAAERGRFLADYRERAFPRLYRRTGASRQFIAAGNLELDAEIRSQVEEMRAAYESELEAFTAEAESTLRLHEPELMIESELRRLGVTQGVRGEHPVDRVFRERSALGLRYADQLRNFLPAELVAELPGVGRPTGIASSRTSTGAGGGRGSLLEQFDQNDDGRLDESEKEAAKAFIRSLSEAGEEGPDR